MREGFSLPATVEALQLLIPCPIYDGLVVKGDDCPSWRGSLVEFKIWINKSTTQMTKQKKKKHDETAHGTTENVFFFGRLKIHLSSMFHHSNFIA